MLTRSRRNARSLSPAPRRQRQTGIRSDPPVYDLPATPDRSPRSEAYSPTSPFYNPQSPDYSVGSAVLADGQPSYSPTSPQWSHHSNLQPQSLDFQLDAVSEKLRQRKLFILQVAKNRLSAANHHIKAAADRIFNDDAATAATGIFGQALTPNVMMSHFIARGKLQSQTGGNASTVLASMYGVRDWSFQQEWLIQVFILANELQASAFHVQFGAMIDWHMLLPDLRLALQLHDNPSLSTWVSYVFPLQQQQQQRA